MKNMTVREVRQEFSRKVERPLRRGEALVLRKRNEILARIIPGPAAGKAYTNFATRQKKIFGNRRIDLNVGEMLRNDRSRL
ncbi:MAG: hypothetical protein ABSF71_16670 [Terriglobia bacterium]|jgi:antitoxin (DNA-binding transcriptional repressor) of toxin-antitoxin stability system